MGVLKYITVPETMIAIEQDASPFMFYVHRDYHESNEGNSKPRNSDDIKSLPEWVEILLNEKC